MKNKLKNRGANAENIERNLKLYLKEISRIPLLNGKEEKALGIRIMKGDQEAVRKMVESNLRFAIKIAKKYRYLGIPFLDLINEANIGLIEAAKRFNVNKDIKFASYAVWWIRQSILKYISTNLHPLKIPLKSNNANFRLVRTFAIAAENNHKLTDGEALREAGVSKKDFDLWLSSRGGAVSTEEIVHPDGSSLTLGETIPQRSIPDPYQQVLDVQLKSETWALLDGLSAQERKVIELRFGLGGRQPLTLKNIADIMDRSRERVRQIQVEALKKLRRNPGAKRLLIEKGQPLSEDESFCPCKD